MQLFYYPVRVVLFVVSLLALLLVGCSKYEKIDVRQTSLVQGLVYKLYDKEPFRGEVYNISGNYFSKLVNLDLRYSSFEDSVTGIFRPSFRSSEASCSASFLMG